MRNPFRSQFKITQPFGARPEYYRQFGLTGHEGIDLIPSSADWAVLALADGKVVRDEDNPRSGAYGVSVTLWHPHLKKAAQYCHLAQNTVAIGQEIKAGHQIGVMGRTGNTQGAHLHLNLFEVDGQGRRLNKGNGYLGGINPQPFLEEQTSVPVEKATFEKLVSNSTRYDAFVAAGFPDVASVRKAIEAGRVTITDTQKIKELEQQLAQVRGERDRLVDFRNQVEQLIHDFSR